MADRRTPRPVTAAAPPGGAIDDALARAAAAEERARELEAVLHAIDDYVYVWEYRPDGSSVPLVESIPSLAFLGLGAATGTGDPASAAWRAHVHPADVERYDAVTGAQARGEDGSGEYRVVRDDGSILRIFDRWRGERRPDGTAVARGVISDVTAMRQAQATSRANEERFRALATAAPIGIYVADEHGTIVYGNERWREIYGVADDDDVDAAWLRCLHPEQRDEARRDWRRAVHAAEPYEATLRLLQPDGGEAWVASRGRPMYSDDGVLIGFAGTDDDITERVLVERELERLSHTDALTGLPNRRHLVGRLRALLDGTDASHPGVAMLDVDHFKRVNDVYGHHAGDDVLVETARRLRTGLPPGAEVARWGGEEFAILLPDVADEDALAWHVERLRVALGAAPIPSGQVVLRISASVGVARGRGAGETPDSLIDRADQALYAAKRRGRDRLVRDTELTTADLAAEEPAVLRVARGLALAASMREGVDELHCDQVADLAVRIAEELGLSAGDVMRCRLGGLLHDVGKLVIPDRILGKRAPLDAAEWQLMRSHPEVGAQIILRVGGLDEAAAAVRHHHERWDGGGYPAALAGAAIPLEARIVAAADAYGAITSNRAHARSRDQHLALEEIRRAAGTQLDPAVAEALCRAVLADRDAAARRLRATPAA